MIQNLKPNTTVTTVEGAKQMITQGPVASQEAIKELGTNGGGFFNANSAHPFENPTPLTNLFEMWLLLVIPAALTYTFGKMVGDTRQGWAIFAAFTVMFLIGVFVCYGFEQAGNPNLAKLGIQSAASATQPGGNMEGKEVRFGVVNSALFATITTDTSCGAVNNMHDSLLPIAGLVPMFNMMTDIVIFGGVGAGMYGILIYCIIAVFIAGLMVGRTPGVSRQEDRAEGSEDGDAGHHRHLGLHPGVQRHLYAGHVRRQGLLEPAGRGHRQHEQQRSARVRRRFCTPTPAAPATMAARSPASTPTRPGTT